ncbi:MAG: hypothetical protein Q8M17_07050 [Actinomycetota bacterium]|nr:hypothetical protein [Actinomycetota bacterium]
MFANTILIAEIARQRQSEILVRAERRHRLFRGPMTGPVARGTAASLPSRPARTSPSEARVA